MKDIDTARLILRLVSRAGLQATIAGDTSFLANELQAAVPPDWLETAWLAEMRLKQWQEDETYGPWSMRAIIERDSGSIIGGLNCHHAPMPFMHDGQARPAVELGYGIYPKWQRKGFGHEAVAGFCDWAAARGVTRFVLSIAPGNDASNALCARLGGRKIGSHIDETDGPEDIHLIDWPA